MAFVSVLPRAHSERGPARMRRSPQVGVSSAESATFTPTATVESVQASLTPVPQAVNTNLPTSVKALAGFIVVLGVIILGIIIWKTRAWRIRKKKGGASNSQRSTNEKGSFDEKMYGASCVSIDLESAQMEKPSKACLAPAVPSTPGTGWVPQIRLDLALPEPAKPRSQQAKETWEKNLAKLMASNSNGSSPRNSITPPPSYYIANQSTPVPRKNLPVPPLPVSLPTQPLPPTPLAAPKFNFEGVTPPPSNKLSPNPARNSSFGLHPVVSTKLSSYSRHSEKKFPRLMNVVNSFEPSMEDELMITVGETIRILEEYEDEWCLVQRVGRIDAEKGVVPRFCLTERLEVIPTHPRLPSVGSFRR